jgi:lambda repressor-like predicted transcriptional regulator
MFTDQKSAFEQHQRLKAELRIRQTSLAEIGRELGVSGTSMSLVGLGKHRSRRIERAIADALGTTPETLYPDRYKEVGT